MQHTVIDADIRGFVDKLQLFLPHLGQLEYYSANEHFQYFIKTTNFSVKVSLEELIACRNKQLTQEHFKAIANDLLKNHEPKNIVNNEAKVQQSVSKTSASLKIVKNAILLFVILGSLLGGAFVVGYYFYNEVQHKPTQYTDGYFTEEDVSPPIEQPKTEDELREELRLKECERATSFINGKINYSPVYKNLFSMKVIGLTLKGNLENRATLATFKNMKLKVSFFSATGAAITTRSFTVYDYLAPKSNTSFEYEIEISNQEYRDIDRFEWAVEAVEYE